MFKAVLKKQLMELGSFYFIDRKTGKRRSKKGIIGVAVLYGVLLCYLGGIFFYLSDSICQPLCSTKLDWLYFAIMILISVALGVFGSVFNTSSGLYKAKDNEFLLSMPIPPRVILISRMFGVWLMGAVFGSLVLLPAVIDYIIRANPAPVQIITSLLTVPVVSVLVLVLSCVLGWVVALITSKLKKKSFTTVIFSLLFIAVYYYAYGNAYRIITYVISNGEALAGTISKKAYPVYFLGCAASGGVWQMLALTAAVAVLFVLVCAVLSRSFTKIAVSPDNVDKTKYKEGRFTSRSIRSALIRKELGRYASSSTYILNSSLGILIMIILAIVCVIKGNWLKEMITASIPAAEGMFPLIIAAALALIVSTNDLTAPSVSLEGKSYWLLRSYPISMKDVVFSKLSFHMILTGIPLLFCSCAACISFGFDPATSLLLCVCELLFTLFMGSFGLMMNILKPDFKWTNETFVIKQSFSVTVTLFGGWGIVILIGGLGYLLSCFLSPAACLGGITALLLCANAVILTVLNKKGVKILSEL